MERSLKPWGRNMINLLDAAILMSISSIVPTRGKIYIVLELSLKRGYIVKFLARRFDETCPLPSCIYKRNIELQECDLRRGKFVGHLLILIADRVLLYALHALLI